jgi:hypothetical protein
MVLQGSDDEGTHVIGKNVLSADLDDTWPAGMSQGEQRSEV